MKCRFLYFLSLFFLPLILPAQEKEKPLKKEVIYSDTIYMMNGDMLPAHITDTSFFGVKLLKPTTKGPREAIIEGEQIYSLKFADGHEKLLYRQDSLAGNEFTSGEARLYMVGQRDAGKGYRSRLVTGMGAVVGASSVVIGLKILSPVPVFAYSALMLIPKIRVKHRSVSNKAFLQYDAYLLGYEKVARRRRAVRSFLGGLAGIAIGVPIWFLLPNQSE